MASVTGMTAEAIDQLMNDMVVSVTVDSSGQIINTRRDGSQINGGSVGTVDSAVNLAWPIGSIFMGVNPNNPNTLIGVGTWVRHGQGKVLVGVSEGETEFNTVNKTGGVKTVTLTPGQMPIHNHTVPQHTHTYLISYNKLGDISGNGSVSSVSVDNSGDVKKTGTTSVAPATNTTNAGNNEAHTNLQPYITVYMWRRTA